MPGSLRVARLGKARVGGMDCPSCADDITRALKKLEGVEDVRVNVVTSPRLVWFLTKKQEAPPSRLQWQLNGSTTDSTPTWLRRNRSRGDSRGVFEASANVITRLGFHRRSREHGAYARIE